MEEIIHAFGIDWRLIVIQLFNFGLLMALLGYFLYKPILKMIDERQAKIKQGVQDAHAAGEKLAHADAESKVITGQAHAESDAIVARAKDGAAKVAADIVSGAHNQSARIAEEARAKAEAEAQKIKQEAEKDIAKTALLVAEKILRDRSHDLGKERAS